MYMLVRVTARTRSAIHDRARLSKVSPALLAGRLLGKLLAPSNVVQK